MNKAIVDRDAPTAREQLQQRHTERFQKITRSIPLVQALEPQRRERHLQYTAAAVGQLGRRQLERVVWPWEQRPVVGGKVPRGRVR